MQDDLEAVLRAYDEHLTDTPAWLFQANPRFYDIAAAVRALDSMNWTVGQYTKQIKSGHRVYIWQSGPAGGVVAVGTILSDPAQLPFQEGPEFIVDEAKFGGEQLRVRMSIDTILDEPLTREVLKAHPVLKDLGVLSFANATNFNVTPQQDAALQAMIGDNPMPTLEERIEEWRAAIGYPTERDVDRKAQRPLLEEGLSQKNLDAVIEDPRNFEALRFGQFAHNAYGGPGPQSVIHRHLNADPEVKSQTLSLCNT